MMYPSIYGHLRFNSFSFLIFIIIFKIYLPVEQVNMYDFLFIKLI